MMAILKDAEWRAYVSVLLVAIVVLFAVGMAAQGELYDAILHGLLGRSVRSERIL